MTERLIIRAHRPLRWLWLGLVAVLALVVSTVGAYRLGLRDAGVNQAEALAQLDVLQGEVERLRTSEAGLRTRLAMLDRGARVDQQALRTVQEELTALQASNLELREAVTFYQGVVSSPMRGDGLRVQDMLVAGDAGSRAYHYRLVLTQGGRKLKRVSGKLGMQLVGAVGDKPAAFGLAELSPDKKADLSFRFRYFQEIEGDWVLPEGFKPHTVRVTLSPRKRDRVELNLAWSEVARQVAGRR